MTAEALVPMRWWHVDSVLQLERRLFPDDPWSPEQFWHELAQPTRTYLVAIADRAVVGYAGAFVLPPDSDLQTVAVDPAFQGRGLARRMLDELIATARAQGCTHMMLEVRADNTSAIALYQSMGFEPISSRASYYPDGSAAIIMRARL